METRYTRKKTRELDIDKLRLQKVALLLRAVNHPLRQQVLQYLHQCGECPVANLYRTLRLDQSVASQHLALLRGAGVVSTRRQARQIFYSVNRERLTEIQGFAGSILTG